MIVLEILKIIGIVLACIAGLVLLIAALVCFVPVRYKINAQGENADIEGRAETGWLLGLLKASAEYKDKKLKYRISVMGISMVKKTLGENEVEALREVIQEEEIRTDATKYTEVSTALSKAEEKESEKTKKILEKKEEAALKKEQTVKEKKEKQAAKKADEDLASFKEKVRTRIKSFKERYRRFKEALRIIRAETTKRAFKYIKLQFLNIVDHIKPRHISGDVCFGLDDPADTALLYGWTAPLSDSFSAGKLILTPEFHKKGISLKILIKGRIFVGYVLLCAVRLIKNRDIQRVINAVRRYFNG